MVIPNIIHNSPDKERQDDNSSKKVVKYKKNGVDLRAVGLWLQVNASDAGGNSHHINPTFEGYDFEKNK
jgi:hypothetical protein